jgi:hypothetical protein
MATGLGAIHSRFIQSRRRGLPLHSPHHPFVRFTPINICALTYMLAVLQYLLFLFSSVRTMAPSEMAVVKWGGFERKCMSLKGTVHHLVQERKDDGVPCVLNQQETWQ